MPPVTEGFMIRLSVSFFVESQNVVVGDVARIARSADIGHGGFGKAGQILFLDAEFGQMLGDAYTHSEFANCIYSGLS